MLQIPVDWDAPPWVRTDVTTRHGGCSLTPWDSLNLGLSTEDDPNHVAENRRIWAHRMGVEYYTPLVQLHGVEIAHLTPQSPREPIAADAAMTVHAQVPCAVLTADCLPILLCSQQQRCVAAIHAGWRGLVNGIIQQTCAQMEAYGPLMAWVGPCCCGQCYEVQQDVYDAAVGPLPSLSIAFQAQPKGGYLFDLQKSAGIILQRAGVQNITFSPYCTKEAPDLLYSYRRSPKTGRQGSAIWMGDEDFT